MSDDFFARMLEAAHDSVPALVVLWIVFVAASVLVFLASLIGDIYQMWRSRGINSKDKHEEQ